MRFLAGVALACAVITSGPAHAAGAEWRVLRGAIARAVLGSGRGRDALERTLAELGARFPGTRARIGSPGADPFERWLRWSEELGGEERRAARSIPALRRLEDTVTAIERELVRRGLDPAARSLTPELGEAALARAEALFLSPVEDAHRAITHDLFHGEVIRSEPFTANGNQTAIIKVWVRNPLNGSVREALFKPRPWGDGEGWNRTTMEYVAYELNRLLGMDYVPPVAYRRNFRIGGQVHSEGALIYLVPDAHRLRDVRFEDWGESPRLLLSDARILDTLLQNPDRHVNQFIRGRHWVDGTYRPVLIDHAASLKPDARTHLGHDDAFTMGPVRVIRLRTWEALRRLDRAGLERLGEFLSAGDVERILRGRDLVLRDVDALIAERGLENVVFP